MAEAGQYTHLAMVQPHQKWRMACQMWYAGMPHMARWTFPELEDFPTKKNSI